MRCPSVVSECRFGAAPAAPEQCDDARRPLVRPRRRFEFAVIPIRCEEKSRAANPNPARERDRRARRAVQSRRQRAVTAFDDAVLAGIDNTQKCGSAVGAAHPGGGARHQEAPGSRPATRLGDRARRQTGERRPPCQPTRQGQGRSPSVHKAPAPPRRLATRRTLGRAGSYTGPAQLSGGGWQPRFDQEAGEHGAIAVGVKRLGPRISARMRSRSQSRASLPGGSSHSPES